MAIDEGDTISIEYTGRLDDGTVFDTSIEATAKDHDVHDPERGYEPLTFDVGDGEVIPGLEDGVVGMEEGDEAELEIPPEEAYGEHDEERVLTYDREEFADMIGIEPEVGQHVHAEGGQHGDVVGVEDDTVDVDFNPHLAGETLTFAIEVVGVE